MFAALERRPYKWIKFAQQHAGFDLKLWLSVILLWGCVAWLRPSPEVAVRAFCPFEIPSFGGRVRLRKAVRYLLACLSFGTLLSLSAPVAVEGHLYRVLRDYVPSSPPYLPQYYFPLEDAEYVSKGTTIAVRYGPVLTDANVRSLAFAVSGSTSGKHEGRVVLADDHKTVIFKPDTLFTPGEKVAVSVSGLVIDETHEYLPLSYTFTVAVNQQPGTPGSSQLADPPVPAKPPRSAYPDFLTVPQDIPHFTITHSSAPQGEGEVFVAPFYWTESTVGSYLLILNQQGQLVYYRSAADALDAWDFKVQPNGQLSYYDQKNSTIYLMDSHYHVVSAYQAGDGYSADLHDFLMLPGGNALLMIYDAETIDMRRVIWGGQRDAVVTGLVIQELDPSRNVIFEWRSWDHFSFFDSSASLFDKNIDLVHANSIALSTDGNLLLSSRNLSEITKIDVQTGDIIWRMGGKENMFKFVNGEPFSYQHDVRQLPNGNLTVFDNHGSTEQLAPSRGVEYALDEANMTVSQVWEYTPDSPVLATYMGNTQRLDDGNTFLSWGAPYTKSKYTYLSMTEVDPNNHVLFEFTFDQPYVSYRAFIYPWHGFPDTKPSLAYKMDGSALTLAYSWNGATEVASYRLYAGDTAQSLDFIRGSIKTDFEDQTRLTDIAATECYFQVAALDSSGTELARSKIISTDNTRCPPVPG